MARDDYFVIAAKILDYLYKCLKKGNCSRSRTAFSGSTWYQRIILELYFSELIRVWLHYRCDI